MNGNVPMTFWSSMFSQSVITLFFISSAALFVM